MRYQARGPWRAISRSGCCFYNRLIAEEFFRPSYTMGILAQGAIADGLEYSAP